MVDYELSADYTVTIQMDDPSPGPSSEPYLQPLLHDIVLVGFLAQLHVIPN